MIGFDKKPTRTGAMIQCYMDLLYLLFQRGTDIRLMRWDEVKPEGIEIEPTKTAGSSGVKVMIPMGDDLRMVFSRIKTISKARSTFIIHTEHGQPYTASGIRSLFSRAAKRAGVEGEHLKIFAPRPHQTRPSKDTQQQRSKSRWLILTRPPLATTFVIRLLL